MLELLEIKTCHGVSVEIKSSALVTENYFTYIKETTMKLKVLRYLIPILSLMTANAFAQSDAMAKIKSEGTIRIGVNTDYRPFGVKTPDGKSVGIEPDLAEDVAKRLNVKVELVPVQAANRVQFLQQGRIDLIISSFGVNEERKKIVGFIEPYYYASGTGVIAKKGSGLKKWDDIRGKVLCGVQGTFYNREMEQKFGASVLAFTSITEAANALLQNACLGLVEDSIVTGRMLSDSKFAEYESPLPPDNIRPWGIAVSLNNLNTPYAKFLSDTVASWHKDGLLLALEKKWGLPQSEYLVQMRTSQK
jgi:polar amino acid transport system substrate-binding protein